MATGETSGTTQTLSMNENIISVIFKHYGPYGFSLVMFLSMWFVAVKPELDRNSFRAAELRAIVTQLNTVSATNERTAQTLERIALLWKGKEN